ncbi:MAG: manganese efflux pump MntP family protein [Spirochaetaceae bacterium]
MGIIEIILIAIALAIDAFAVSITCGINTKVVRLKNILKVGLLFGLFQAVMPLIGNYAGNMIPFDITTYDHWIAFGLLSIIGIHMIKESRTKNDPLETKKSTKDIFGTRTLIFAAIATSIDALAAGFSASLLNAKIILLASSAGIITLILSCIGVYLGRRIGHIFEKKAELLSGIVLILIGVNIVYRHMFQ